jgi:hypothetical protein
MQTLIAAYALTFFTALLYIKTYHATLQNDPHAVTRISGLRMLCSGLILFFALNLPLKHSILMGILFGMTIYYGIKKS